ncbi:VWA domain-containing protein [Granulicella mallensis]|uniref:VWFA-related protein n=1 Tax=Granulicella mallensis TaxID=940614 RepID=A0A7W7ZQA9_9BACT|nr:VWA domain-containing protein [Granulicella mallensis]MBB5063296.1 VWFA-related protein [Granulicella mallensis]
MRSLSASVSAAASASLPLSLSLVLALSLGLAAGAQQPAAPAPAAAPAQAPTQVEQQQAPSTATNTIRRNVRLVVLDGVVVDKQGKAVTDLKREEFHITEDGAPQQIRNFEVPGQYTPTPDVTINSTADLDRLAPRAPVNIVLLDEFNTRFEDMAFARYSLKKWLEKQPDKLDTPTMLIAVDLQHFTVLRDYTQNKEEILNALDHHFVAYPWQVHQFAWVAERYNTALYSLRRIAEASIGHFGHKNMIWIGRGFPTFDYSLVSADTQLSVHSSVEQTVNELRDARVTLYTIDPAGLQVNPGEYGRAAALFAPFGGDPDFQALARATGGRNLYGRNDVDAEIGTSVRDGSSLYTLTYVPTDNSEEEHNRFRKIKVTLDRPGLTFATREGYYPNRAPARPNNEGKMGKRLASELANAGSSNMAYDAVSFTVTTSPTDSNTFKFHVEPRGVPWYFTDGSKPRYTRLIVMSTTFDRKGKELKADGRRMEFKAPASAPATGRIEIPLDFEVKFDAVPKAVRARLVVRVEASGRMGTADLTLGPGATASSFATQDAAAPASAPATP